MSRPMSGTPKRCPQGRFTDEFKASAVRLVLDEGNTVGAAARDLHLTESAARLGQAGPSGSDASMHGAYDRGA